VINHVVDRLEDGLMTLLAGVMTCERLSDWQLTRMSGEESPALMAHVDD